MSTINSSFHPWIISEVGPWEMVPVSCCVIVGVTKFALVEDDDADVPVVWIKGGVAPGKNPQKRGGVEEVIFGSRAGTEGGRTGEGPPGKGPAKRPGGP